MKTRKNIIMVIISIVLSTILLMSFTTTANRKAIRYEYEPDRVLRHVTYQNVNVWGMDIGKEYTLTEWDPNFINWWNSIK